MDGNLAMNSEFENMSEEDMKNQPYFEEKIVMPEKTAIQQAIEKIEAEIKRKSLSALKDENTSYYISGLENAKSFLSLVAEKEQLINSYKQGRSDGYFDTDDVEGFPSYYSAEDYLKMKYGIE